MKLPGSVTILSIVLLFLAFILFKPQDPSNRVQIEDSRVQGVSTENIQSDQVQEVIDGDTFRLGSGEKVRLIGINAPESGQPYYAEAKSHLEKLLHSNEVKLITDTQVQDQYGRILAYAYNDAQVDINHDMVQKGLAVVETVAPNVSRADIFLQAQLEARNTCSGMWEGLCDSEGLCIQISEINAASQDKTKNGEWIQFSNTCATSINLNNYLLKDTSASNVYLFKDKTLASKKSMKLYSGCGVDSESSIYWVCPEQKNYVWNDTGDRAYLYNSEGRLISELGY